MNSNEHYFSRGLTPQNPLQELEGRLKQSGRFEGAGGYLMRFWIQVLLDLKIPPHRFETLLSDYIARHAKVNQESEKSKLAGIVTPGNLRRELVSSAALTWRSSLRGWCVLKARFVDITVKLTWGTGKSTMHTVSKDLVNYVEETTPSPSDVNKRLAQEIKDLQAVIAQHEQNGVSDKERIIDMANLELLKEEYKKTKERYSLAQIVNNPNDISKYCVGHGGLLMRLWYQILSDQKMTPERMKYLLTVFIKAQQKLDPNASDSKPSAYSALWREFIGEFAITWRRFIKGLMILKVRELELNIRLHWLQNKTTIHSIAINLRKFQPEGDQDLTAEDLS